MYSYISVIQKRFLPCQQLLTHCFPSRKKILDRLEVMSNDSTFFHSSCHAGTYVGPPLGQQFEHLRRFLLSRACPVTYQLLAVRVAGSSSLRGHHDCFYKKKEKFSTGKQQYMSRGKCQCLNPSLAFPSELSSLDALPFLTSGFEEVVVLAGIGEAQVVPPAVNWRRHFLIMTTAYAQIAAKRGAGRRRSLLLTWKKGPEDNHHSPLPQAFTCRLWASPQALGFPKHCAVNNPQPSLREAEA